MKKKGIRSAVLAAAVAAMFMLMPGAAKAEAAETEGVVSAEETVVGEEAESSEDAPEIPKYAPSTGQTGWVEEEGCWYYFDTVDHYYSNGVYQIGNNFYYFKDSGIMLKDEYTYFGEDPENKVWAREDGRLYVNTWVHDSYWDRWGYAQADGKMIREGSYKIKGKVYYFSNYQIEYLRGRVLENDSVHGECYVRVKDDGSLYAGEWYHNTSAESLSEEWEYYDAEGFGANGIVTIKGKTYYFRDGQMQVDCLASDGTNAWRIESDGKAYKLNNGTMTVVNGKTYYAVDGMFVEGEIVEIDGKLYYFNYGGQLLKDSEFDSYSNSYKSKADGELYRNEWFTDVWEDSYYYGDDGAMAKGLYKIGDKMYYFSSYGVLNKNVCIVEGGVGYVADSKGRLKTVTETGWVKVEGIYYYFNKETKKFYKSEAVKIGNNYYGFNWRGQMYDDDSFLISGIWYQAKKNGPLYVNSWYGNYYYGEGGKAASGFVTINDALYYCDNSGLAKCDCFFEVEGQLYHADTGCKVTEISEDGFYYADANRYNMYYISGGKLVVNDWVKVNGKYYYFDSYGSAFCDCIYEINGRLYMFNMDGTMVTEGWVKRYEGTYHVTKSGALSDGDWKSPEGNWYYFSEGIMQTGIVNANGTLYLYGQDGVYLGRAKQNGWNKIKDAFYYTQDGELLTGYFEVDNKGYFADNSGRIQVDGVYYVPDFDDYLAFDEKGYKVTSGWFLCGGAWYYIDSETECVVSGEDREIGGKTYCFDYNGKMVVTDHIDYNDGQPVACTTDKKTGEIIKKSNITDGWVALDGNYYYVKNGKYDYTGWVGNYYVMYGRMLRNTVTPDGYYVGNNGVYRKTAGWITLGGYGVKSKGSSSSSMSRLYIKSGGKIAAGEWLQIGKNKDWYYFGDYHEVYTGIRRINGTWYAFDENGVLKKTIGTRLPERWLHIENDWYYFRGQALVYGSLEINGIIYTFEDSRMIGEGFTEYRSSESYLNDATGAMQAYTGWKMVNGSWYYFQNNNKAFLYGFHYDGTNNSYITADGAVTGYRVIYGKLYHFGEKGSLIETIDHADGWAQYDGNWYYFRNGVALQESACTIKGKTYLFKEDGSMAKEEAVGDYYADKNGMIVTNTWKTIDGVKCYFGADGRRYGGVHVIDGVTYYFEYQSSSHDY